MTSTIPRCCDITKLSKVQRRNKRVRTKKKIDRIEKQIKTLETQQEKASQWRTQALHFLLHMSTHQPPLPAQSPSEPSMQGLKSFKFPSLSQRDRTTQAKFKKKLQSWRKVVRKKMAYQRKMNVLNPIYPYENYTIMNAHIFQIVILNRNSYINTRDSENKWYNKERNARFCHPCMISASFRTSESSQNERFFGRQAIQI